MENLYTQPEVECLTAEKIKAGLNAIERTGWVRRHILKPETVGEHTDSLMLLGREVASEISELNAERLVHILEVHDWPELKVGDLVIAGLPDEERKKLKEHKREAEESAMKSICANLGSDGAEYLKLWLEFEDGTSPEADVARQLDKLQAVIKAVEYLEGGEPSADPRGFLEYSRPFITHPVLIRMLAALEQRIK